MDTGTSEPVRADQAIVLVVSGVDGEPVSEAQFGAGFEAVQVAPVVGAVVVVARVEPELGEAAQFFWQGDLEPSRRGASMMLTKRPLRPYARSIDPRPPALELHADCTCTGAPRPVLL